MSESFYHNTRQTRGMRKISQVMGLVSRKKRARWGSPGDTIFVEDGLTPPRHILPISFLKPWYGCMSGASGRNHNHIARHSRWTWLYGGYCPHWKLLPVISRGCVRAVLHSALLFPACGSGQNPYPSICLLSSVVVLNKKARVYKRVPINQSQLFSFERNTRIAVSSPCKLSISQIQGRVNHPIRFLPYDYPTVSLNVIIRLLLWVAGNLRNYYGMLGLFLPFHGREGEIKWGWVSN